MGTQAKLYFLPVIDILYMHMKTIQECINSVNSLSVYGTKI